MLSFRKNRQDDLERQGSLTKYFDQVLSKDGQLNCVGRPGFLGKKQEDDRLVVTRP